MARPEDAQVDPRLIPLLAGLSATFSQPAVISGRDRATLKTRVPGLLTIGSYGLELPPSLAETGHPDGFDATATRRAITAAAAELEGVEARWPGTRLERKAWGLSLHFREAAEAFRLAEPRDVLEVIAERHRLRVVPGRLVLELRPLDADKGRAIEYLVDRLEPSGVLFTGDDLGDIPAWERLRELAGHLPALGVGVGSDETPESAFASCDIVLEDQHAVAAMMQALLDFGGAPPPD